jgi:hypothetical protein
MVRSMSAVLSAALLALGAAVTSAGPASAASCTSAGWSTVSGGYRVSLYCSGAGFVNGFGSTRDDAAAEAQALADLYTDTGVDCSGASVGMAPKGRSAELYCTGGGYIQSYGTTLTDAAREARALATLYATSDLLCDGRSAESTIRGLQVRLYCTGEGFVEGIGNTLTDAAQEARLAAS